MVNKVFFRSFARGSMPRAKFHRVYFFVVPVLAGQKYNKNQTIAYIDAHNHLVGHFRAPRGPVEDWYGAARVAVATMDKLGIRKMIILKLSSDC